jgi:hypothetical protein
MIGNDIMGIRFPVREMTILSGIFPMGQLKKLLWISFRSCSMSAQTHTDRIALRGLFQCTLDNSDSGSEAMATLLEGAKRARFSERLTLSEAHPNKKTPPLEARIRDNLCDYSNHPFLAQVPGCCSLLELHHRTISAPGSQTVRPNCFRSLRWFIHQKIEE